MNLSADIDKTSLLKSRIKNIFEGKEKLGELDFIEGIDFFTDDEKKYINSLIGVFDLLNYHTEKKIFSLKKANIFDNKDIQSLLKKIVKIGSFRNKLTIYFLNSSSKINSLQIQYIVKKLQISSFGSQYFLLVLANDKEKNQLNFIFPFFTGKDIEIRKLNVDLNNVYRTDLDVLSGLFLERDDYNEIDVLRIWKEAFSVEKVNERFFDQYFFVFNKLWKEILLQLENTENSLNISKYIAHQLLNRLMFCFFIEKKSDWLGNKQFIKLLVNEYKKLKLEKKIENDSFYNLFLKPLFLESFNKKFISKSYFSEKINDTLLKAPYLNGGLFEENEYDKFNLKINDDLLIDQILNNFLFTYNFTIVENAPLEKEVAINPELIGRVYEKFVNLETTPQAKEKYEKEGNSKGIVYTHEREIDFMCKKSLVEYFRINLPELNLDQVYDLIYSNIDEFKGEYLNHKIILKIKKLLDELKILDPAVGSGSFLVGFLNILVSLHKKLQKFYPDISFTDFGLKKKIIKENLYGVDVMDWAVKIAELRLWLSLIIESDLTKERLQLNPLLPNLDFKIRQGDSLIQEIANFDLTSFDSQLKRDFHNLINIKLRYYEGDRKLTYEEIEAQKRRIIIDFIERKIIEKTQQKQKLLISDSQSEQQAFFEDSKQLKIQEKFKTFEKNKIEKIEKEIEQLKEIKKTLQEKKQLPFFWEIDFVEVFFGNENKKGFDIVIGNPPYVRQEDIAPPLLSQEKYSNKDWLEKKREYKKKLQNMIENIYGKEFIPDGRSDLYVYFYFKSLSLLDRNGIFCFICSNSWLDVEYGRSLQEFLLRRTKIIGIYDNQVQRSFSQADINTIIIFTSAPSKDEKSNLSYIAKFIAFKKPYEEVLKKDILLKIDKMSALYIDKPIFELVKNRYEDDLVKVFPISQNDLYKDGLVKEEKEGQTQAFEKYEGNKWGGKFLRAPAIYWKIMEKGKDKLVRLKYLVKIDGYIHDNNTGNKYPRVKFIKTIKDIDSILISRNTARILFYGVKENKSSRILAPIWYPRTLGDRHIVPFNSENIFGKEFYKIIPKESKKSFDICLELNLTFSILQREIIGLVNLGGGGLKFSAFDIGLFEILNDITFPQKDNFFYRKQNSIFFEFGFDPKKPIREQEPKPLLDRKALDDVIFDALGLTEEERKEVYWAVAELVKNRLEKAKRS